MIARRTTAVATIAGVLMLSSLCVPAQAAQMFSLDLQSLAYLSTAVIEGDISDAKVVNWVDVLAIHVSRVYSGDIKVGNTVIVGLSAYGKSVDGDTVEKFVPGDHLILFIQPVTQEQWKKDGIPYWPASSGVKVVAGGKVTGMRQLSNPGSYANIVDEGDAGNYRDKVADAVDWAGKFRKQLVAKCSDASWLLEQLKSRPAIKLEDRETRDHIAVTLCLGLAATRDQTAIDKAKALRTDRYERQLLDLEHVTQKEVLETSPAQ